MMLPSEETSPCLGICQMDHGSGQAYMGHSYPLSNTSKLNMVVFLLTKLWRLLMVAISYEEKFVFPNLSIGSSSSNC